MCSKIKAKPTEHFVNPDGQLCFTDLHNPILPWKFALMNKLLALPMRNKKFCVDEIVGKACKMTGLSDWGDEEALPFREPLRIFLEDVNAACTSPLGKLSIEATLVNFLVNRLKIIQVVKEHPEILNEEVDDPVVIVGVPRSGTTHLHRALARCSAFRSLKMYELESPVDERKNLDDERIDPRLLKCEKILKQAKSMRPGFLILHDIEANDVEEELGLMAMTCQSAYMLSIVCTPRYTDWYIKSEKKPMYLMLKMALQVIQWQDRKNGTPKRPFLLKAPSHLESIPNLMEMFPNAKLINTHRSLRPVFFSLLYLLVSRYAFVCRRIDLGNAAAWILSLLVQLGAGAGDCQLVDKDKVINVLFDHYAQDNRGSIKKILGLLKVDYSDEDWHKIEEYLTETSKFIKNRVLYDPVAFGLDMKEVEKKLAYYTELMEGPSFVGL